MRLYETLGEKSSARNDSWGKLGYGIGSCVSGGRRLGRGGHCAVEEAGAETSRLRVGYTLKDARKWTTDEKRK